jgi:hypothetical protein
MRRLLAGLAALTASLGLCAPATASNPASSCSGLAGSSRAGQPGAQAEVITELIAHEVVPPGVIISEFSQFHLGSADICLE